MKRVLRRVRRVLERRLVRGLRLVPFSQRLLAPGGRNVTAPLPAAGSLGCRVHLGCGEIVLPGFLNVEGRWFPHVHYVRSVESLPFLANGSAELVYASHVLEHVSYPLVGEVLVEWARTLAPGGKLYVAVPDLDLIVKRYLEGGREVASIIGPLMGEQDYPANTHRAVFNRASLGEALERAGLTEVRPFSPDEILPSEVWDSSRHEVSLNLVGTKR